MKSISIISVSVKGVVSMVFPLSKMYAYCNANKLCTRMDMEQYETFLQEAGSGNLNVSEAALILKFCSSTDKTRDEILIDLVQCVREMR